MVGQRMLHGLKWSVLGRGLSQTLSWALMLVTIRLLAPEDFGLMALCESVMIFIAYSNELGLGASIIQKDRLPDREITAMNSFFLGWNLALYGLLFAAAPAVAAFYREPALIDVLRVVGLSLVILSLAVVPRSLLVRDLRFKAITLVKVASGLSTGLVTVTLALAGHGVWALVAGGLVGPALETIGYHLVLRAPPRFGLAFASLRPHFRFGAGIMLQRLVWLAYMKADIFVVGRLFDTRTTGIYAIGRELSMLPLDRIGAALNQVVLSGFARIKDDRAVVADLFRRGIGLMCLAAFPVFFGISAVAAPLVAVVLGPSWMDAAAVIALLALGGPPRLFNTVAVEILNALGAVRTNLWQITLTGALVVTGLFTGVQWGLVGLCAGWLAGYLAGTALHLGVLLRRIGVPASVPTRAALRPLLGCLAMYAAVVATLAAPLARPPVAGLLVGVAAGVAVYAGWALLGMRAELNEARAALRGSR
jgi:O-antigen/teichoic acid export membrane protein